MGAIFALVTMTLAGAETNGAVVDSKVCAGCHPAIARNYRLTGMARSAYRPTLNNMVEDYRTHNALDNTASGRHYVMTEKEGRFFQTRSQAGYRGEETNIVQEQVDFVIGSGNHARTYLRRTQQGVWHEFPVSWYSEQGGYWAMSPGYDRADQEDFRRTVTEDCFFCHNGYPDYASKKLPEGIDCQRCHGPGAAHVAAASSQHPEPQVIRTRIVNPRRLERDRQLEVCLQCHLETTSSPLPAQLRRFDRDVFSYRPGQPLGDYAFYFDRNSAKKPVDRFEIAGGAYRLRQSACFQRSDMTCSTCHDPHDVPRGEKALQHYASVCQNCHRQSHKTQSLPGTCMDCHMPKRRAEDAVHVVLTDHFIRKVQPAGDLIAPFDEAQKRLDRYEGPVKRYYPADLSSNKENNSYLALAQVREGSNLSAGITDLTQAVGEMPAPRWEFQLALGKALAKDGYLTEAIVWFRKALTRSPANLAVVKELTAALFASGQTPQAVNLLEQNSRAADAPLLTDLANGYLRQNKTSLAEIALQRSLKQDAELPESYNLLGLLKLRQNNKPGAEAAFRESIRWEPRMAQAHYNLGNLLAERGDYTQAAYHFERAIESNPNYSEAHYKYGLSLEAGHNYGQAETEFQTAIKIKPGYALPHNDLADLLAAQQRQTEAAAEYKAAIAADGKFAEARVNLANLLLSGGNLDEAEKQLRSALQLNAGYFEAHLLLADLLSISSRKDQAKMHYVQAALSPDPEIRAKARQKLKGM